MTLYDAVIGFSIFFFIMGGVAFFVLLVVSIGKSIGSWEGTKLEPLAITAAAGILLGFLLLLVSIYSISK